MTSVLTTHSGKVYLQLTYDATDQWVYADWVGYQTHRQIVAGAEACLLLLKEHACSHLLNDNRQLVGPWDHAVDWLVTEWSPRARAQGLTYFAQVARSGSLAALSAEGMIQALDHRLQMRQFSDMTLAQHWLRQTPPALDALT